MMAVCGILCKSVILIFNILYTVVGLAFLGVGVWLRARYPDASSGSGDYVLIAVGIVMLITAITGDIGGCGNKSFSLATFCVLLVVLMAAQLALYVQREKVDHRLVEFYVFLYTIYITAAAGDPVVAGTLRVIHYTMDCCGAVGLVGVDPISHTCPDPSGFLDRFMSPCPSVLVDVMGKGPPLAMGIFYGNAMLMLLCLLCSLALYKILKMAASPRYTQLTQTVVSISGSHAQPHLYPYLYPGDGVVLTSMEPELLAEA
ncbi:CD9 antigen-like isoform X1 [Gadus chalcogrammus]|uniref:CD9 antigen-like isoform X1 n=1 Tax=Gadus chalcogrammus TaxID=1042646 RepID=UPI0024C29813|nr:CD9 antigen-like isoform X1 [Gadus chalcogrammus]XP_056431686.1 CD9 antigen-like isoform X1 [Gadus chalcogrammus]XP_056431695.1 CD9 antigen-like isoform X1 [Gadus chalcogrammus]